LANGARTVDRLDRQILETIANAPSLVRTVTRQEIEAGVLFPSATALDIKRNLPVEVPLSLVDSRLNYLENDGYIFYNTGRWWLTRKGRIEIGEKGEQLMSNQIQKPVRAILEETFVRHESQEKVEKVDGITARLDELYSSGISIEERHSRVKEMLAELLDAEIKNYLQSRMDSVDNDVAKLEAELANRKAELQRIRKLLGEKDVT
jgi:hypothetical protein